MPYCNDLLISFIYRNFDSSNLQIHSRCIASGIGRLQLNSMSTGAFCLNQGMDSVVAKSCLKKEETKISNSVSDISSFTVWENYFMTAYTAAKETAGPDFDARSVH